LTFTTAYTFSKLIDDASSVFDAAILTGPVANFPVADSFNRRLERDLSNGDIPHTFSSGFVYELPVGKGRRVDLGGWRQLLLGDWQLAGIIRLQSGIPVAVTQATNFNSFAGFGIQRPNRTSDPELPAEQRTTARYFNTAAFSTAPQFTLGSSSRNPVRGPGYQTADVMVGKTFPLTERFRIEFRAEAFNVTNTPPLGNPNGNFGTAAFGTITTGPGDRAEAASRERKAMNRRSVLALAVLGTIAWGVVPAQAESSSEAIGNAIRKSLPLLGKTGPIFFQKAGCISCHNISLPSLAMVLASERGFTVDEAARKENIKAALASRNFFEPKDLMKLAEVPGQTMTTGYTLIALAAEKYPGDALTDAMALWSASTQFGDGSWNLPSHHAPIEYSPFTGTALGLRALQLYGPPAKRQEFEA
jgi:hypothetical protein